jgi:hypothetical protein
MSGRADPGGCAGPRPAPRGVGRVLIMLARMWQTGPSVLLGPTCRFHPSCSAYAIEAVSRYGARRGAWLAARRLCRCRPLGGRGYDPVP